MRVRGINLHGDNLNKKPIFVFLKVSPNFIYSTIRTNSPSIFQPLPLMKTTTHEPAPFLFWRAALPSVTCGVQQHHERRRRFPPARRTVARSSHRRGHPLNDNLANEHLRAKAAFPRTTNHEPRT